MIFINNFRSNNTEIIPVNIFTESRFFFSQNTKKNPFIFFPTFSLKKKEYLKTLIIFINFFILSFFWNKSRVSYYVNNWIYTTNHKRIAINYFWFVILSGIVGMVLATVIRLEFAYPGVGVFAGDSIQYLSLASAHGVIMVFFMIMPLLFGAFANFLLPTQLGVHDVAFPRLNSAAFWFLPGGLLMLCQLVCVDRRYQRMNCFNIREVQSLLKRKFFVDLINTKDHHQLLNKTSIGLRFKTETINTLNSNILLSYLYGLETNPFTKNIKFFSLSDELLTEKKLNFSINSYFFFLINKLNNFNFFYYINNFFFFILYNNWYYSNYNFFFQNFWKNIFVFFITSELTLQSIFFKIYSFFFDFFHLPLFIEKIIKNIFLFPSYLYSFIINIKITFLNIFINLSFFENVKLSLNQFNFIFHPTDVHNFKFFFINFKDSLYEFFFLKEFINYVTNTWLFKYLDSLNIFSYETLSKTATVIISFIWNEVLWNKNPSPNIHFTNAMQNLYKTISQLKFKNNETQLNYSFDVKNAKNYQFNVIRLEKIDSFFPFFNITPLYLIIFNFFYFIYFLYTIVYNFISFFFNFTPKPFFTSFNDFFYFFSENYASSLTYNFFSDFFQTKFYINNFKNPNSLSSFNFRTPMIEIYDFLVLNDIKFFINYEDSFYYKIFIKAQNWFKNKYEDFSISSLFNSFLIFLSQIGSFFFNLKTFIVFTYISNLNIFKNNLFFNKIVTKSSKNSLEFNSNYLNELNNKEKLLLMNEESNISSRNLKFNNPVFKYDYKSGDYFPKLYKEVYAHLYSSILDLTSGLRTSPWYLSNNTEELIKTNFDFFISNMVKTQNISNNNFHNWSLNKFFHTDAFHNFFFFLQNNNTMILNFKFVSIDSLNNKFQKMFLTSSLQQRIYSNWRQLKFTREAWRCKLLAARHQKTLFRRYVNEDGVFWSIERNAKDLIPGWAMITPFSSRTRFTAIGKTDIGLMGVLLVLNSSIISGANFLVTYRYLSTLNNRKMRDARAFFTEAVMVASWMMILANPMLVIGIIMLLSDRHWQTSFFDYSGGGDTVLFQHMFWFFGHPEVYIIIIPTFGFTNTMISYYLKKRVSARASLLYSMYTIAFLGFFVWGHHMYMVGLAHTTRMLFSTLTVMISVPAATKIMHWCVTTVNSSFMMELPLLFTFTFIFFFVSGGISGMCVAHTGMDVLFHDTFYVIGHFHVMLAGGAMFASFGAFYFYFPAIFGVKYSRIYAYLHYTYYLIGQLMTVIPMFWLGYAGMPRRVLDYPASFGGWHSVISAGHMLNVAGLMAFFIMIFDSLRQARAATRNSFGISRFNTRLNFYIYEIARSTFLQQKTLFIYRQINRKTIKLNNFNYNNYEPYELVLISYSFIKK